MTAGLTSPDFLSREEIERFRSGSHHRLYELFGAHPGRTPDGEPGVRFALWAPKARKVSVIGDFNDWDPSAHPLSQIRTEGIWMGWVPGASSGERYRFQLKVTRRRGGVLEKADPFARYCEEPPATASVISDSEYHWNDIEWMKHRADRNSLTAPISIYEIHPGSWRRHGGERDGFFSYRQLAPILVEYVRELGFTHVEFLPLMEHPFFGSWGYQVTGYFAPTSRFGPPDGLKYLIDQLHQAGIGVILDWVPSHFPGDDHALRRFDGTPLYEHPDPRRGFHPDWNSMIFDYGRPEVRSFLLSSAHFWCDHFHADGLRVDGVASMLYLDYSREDGEWTPNIHGGNENLEAVAFLRTLNETIYAEHPDVQTFAEESSAWPGVSHPVSSGGLGFGLKWDMGWMNDTLTYLSTEPAGRGEIHDRLTFRGVYAGSENFVLPLSHDEVVYGKGSLLDRMPGREPDRFADLRLLLGYQYALQGKKLLFMGGEFAQEREWNHDEQLAWELLDEVPNTGVKAWVAALNRLYRDEPALHRLDCENEGFEWIDADDAEGSVFTFLRHGGSGGRPVVVAANFSDRHHEAYSIGVPHEGEWKVLLHSEDSRFGGGGFPADPVLASPDPDGPSPFAIRFPLTPRSIVFFR